jgi:hypothetical protein
MEMSLFIPLKRVNFNSIDKICSKNNKIEIKLLPTTTKYFEFRFFFLELKNRIDSKSATWNIGIGIERDLHSDSTFVGFNKMSKFSSFFSFRLVLLFQWIYSMSRSRRIFRIEQLSKVHNRGHGCIAGRSSVE